jgi:hypothetical protein
MDTTVNRVFLILVLMLSATAARAQSGLRSVNFTTASASSAINNVNTGLAYHAMVWHVLGTASVCTVALDTSTDGITWSAGGAITGQTCTSTGGSAVVNVIANYVRINVTALTVTVGSSVSVTWEAWTCNPASCGGGGGGGGIGGTIALGQVAFGNGVNTIAGSNLFTFTPSTPNTALALLNASPCSLTQISQALFCSDGTNAASTAQVEVVGGDNGINHNPELCVTHQGALGNTGSSRGTTACWSEQSNGGGGLVFSQNGRGGGGIDWIGTGGGALTGALEVGVFGIVDPTLITEFQFVPDGEVNLIAPNTVDQIGFLGKDGLATKVASIGINNSIGDAVFQAIDTAGTIDLQLVLEAATGNAELYTGATVVAQSWDASQNTIMANDASAKSLHCGVLNTTSCVLTGYGSTSGTATITWPAVAGTTTNPIAFSNAISTPSLLATGIVDGTAPVTVTTGTTATLGAGTFKSGYTLNQEGTAATGVTYTLPATSLGLQYCVANSGTTGVVNIGVLTVYPPSGSFVILNGVVNTVGGGGTHGVVSGGAAGDAACFVAINSTHWQVWVGQGTWTEN